MAKSRTTKQDTPAPEGAAQPEAKAPAKRKTTSKATSEKAAPKRTTKKTQAAGEETPKRTRGKKAQTQASAGNATAVSDDDIARRAHELFESRGGEHGYHHEDWYEAERQLRAERGGQG